MTLPNHFVWTRYGTESGEAAVSMTEEARVMGVYELARGTGRSDRVSADAAGRAVAGPRAADDPALLRGWPVWTASTVETRQAKRVR